MQLDLFAANQQPIGLPSPPLLIEIPAPSAPSTDAASEAPKTLADVAALYADAASEHPRRVKIRSAFRGVGRVLGKPLHEIPTDTQQLRVLVASANPALVGIKPRRWGELKSNLFCGLRDGGVAIISMRDGTALSAEWAELHAALADRGLQIGMHKFMRFCTRCGIAPSAVTAETFAEFLAELESSSLHPDPKAAYRQAAKHWNEAAARIVGWPQVVAQTELDPRRYALPWEAFRPSFVETVDAFLEAKANGDEFADSYAPAVRPATTKARREMLRRCASALVLSGAKSAAQITDLATLCEIENVRTQLRFFRDRSPGKKITEHALNHAWLLRTVARFWLDDEAAALAIAKLIAPLNKELAPIRASMRPKNRERLRQFDLDENMVAMIDLPARTLRRIQKKPEPTYRDAVAVMHALMIALLTHAPIRSSNLVELEMGAHLLDMGKGARRMLRIHLPEAITKTHRTYDAPLPHHLIPLLDAWVTIYRRRICSAPNVYLFPGPRGTLRSRDSVAAELSRFVKRETGLTVHLHLFRHLAAKIILDQDANAIEVVRQLLGHTTTRITERAYAELRTDPAFQTLDAALQRLSAPTPRRNRPSRRGARP